MVSTRVALVTLVLAAARCAANSAKESSSAAPTGGAMNTESAPATQDNSTPGPATGSAAPTTPTKTPDPEPARDQARANGIIGPSDNRVGSDFKSGFDDEPKGGKKDGTATATPPPAEHRVAGASAPTVRVDIATLQGNPSGSLKSLAEDHLTELRACYDKARAKKADVKGRLDVSFSVNGEGTVIAPMVATTSTTKDRTLGSCVIGIVAKLKLDRVATPPIKGVLVFVFGE
jgi:hypothetical protein